MPSTTVTASNVTQGRVEYESAIPRSTDEALDLWEATQKYVHNISSSWHSSRQNGYLPKIQGSEWLERGSWRILQFPFSYLGVRPNLRGEEQQSHHQWVRQYRHPCVWHLLVGMEDSQGRHEFHCRLHIRQHLDHWWIWNTKKKQLRHQLKLNKYFLHQLEA